MIDLEDATWTYEGHESPVLADLSLHVDPGEVVALCGASGSGKSTALRLMNGLIPHFHEGRLSGRVVVDGLDVATSSLEAVGRRTGTVLQHPRRQFFTDHVRDELAFALENFGVDPAEIRSRVDACAAEHQVDHLLDRRLSQLSGGQQQAVACAAAHAHRPNVLLLDEPTSNLSAAAITEFARTLRRLKDDGVTTVIAEHRLHFLRDVADRVVLLREGRIAEEWSAREFARLDDEPLEAEGLRSRATVRATLPTVVASGSSFATGPSGEEPAAPEAPTGLELRSVRCRLGGRLVLDIEQARLPSGAVTAVTGPNGAGKSTLARIVTGLQHHHGHVLLDGRALSRRERQRHSAIVMQDVQRQLFTESLDAELHLSGARTRADVDDLLARFGLSGMGHRHPLSLSGGQQQRLVVATVEVAGRRIAVLDEPSSGVDRRHLRSISAMIRDLADRGAIVILISHDDDLLARAADQCLELTPV